MPDRGNQISILAMKNLKLVALMFKMMEHCSKDYKIKCVNSISVLQCQHQWEMEQKKINDDEVPKEWGDNYKEHNVAPQAHKKYEGDPTGLCGLVPCQGSPNLAWIWCLP